MVSLSRFHDGKVVDSSQGSWNRSVYDSDHRVLCYAMAAATILIYILLAVE